MTGPYRVTASSELMQNYLQAEILRPGQGGNGPESDFQAVQTSAGDGVLVWIGDDGALHATVEAPGDRFGWLEWDISSAQAEQQFGRGSGARCTHFAVAQCADATIRLAMTLSHSGHDHLYVGGFAQDVVWSERPVPEWRSYPYDDPDPSRRQEIAHITDDDAEPRVTVTGLFISDAVDAEFVVVDVLRSRSVFRYCIDLDIGRAEQGVGQASAPAWQARPQIAIEPGAYESCLGRASGSKVDGIYTVGRLTRAGSEGEGAVPPFTYRPLYNVYGSGPPPAVKLRLPPVRDDVAIAACRNDDGSSDLYAAADGCLYYFASAKQKGDTTGIPVCRSEFFAGVKRLFASRPDRQPEVGPVKGYVVKSANGRADIGVVEGVDVAGGLRVHKLRGKQRTRVAYLPVLGVARVDHKKRALYVAAQVNLAKMLAAPTAPPARRTPAWWGELRDHYGIAHPMVMIWGLRELHGRREIFYTTARDYAVGKAVGKEGEEGGWSVPIPILTDVERVAPYVNRADSANTFFAHTRQDGRDRLVMAVRSPHTSIWSFRDITLAPTSPTLAARAFTSYTTRIEITDAHGLPASREKVRITATNTTAVHVNHRYYSLGPEPVEIDADDLGSLTIVEAVNGLAGARLTIQAGDSEVLIDPMGRALDKALKSEDVKDVKALRLAEVKEENGDPAGKTGKLIRPGTTDQALKDLLAANGLLEKARRQLAARGTGPSNVASPIEVDEPGNPSWLKALRVAAGDFFRMVRGAVSGVERAAQRIITGAKTVHKAIQDGLEGVVQFMEDTATGAWKVITSIGGKVVSAVLDCVEHVVAAAGWLYTTVVESFEQLIKFLKYLFEWEHIKQTKRLLEKLARLYLRHQVERIGSLRHTVDDRIEKAIEAVEKWAEPERARALAGQPMTGTRDAAKQARVKKLSVDAPGTLLVHHVQGNVESSSAVGEVKDLPMGPFAPILDFLKAEEAALEAIAGDFRATAEDLRDRAGSVLELLKAIVKILAKGALRQARALVDLVLDLAGKLGGALLDMLDQEIRIPVVSDILARVGIPTFSVLDILCWVAAVPATIICKLATPKRTPPFPPGDPVTDMVEKATSWDELMGGARTSRSSRAAPATAEPEWGTPPVPRGFTKRDMPQPPGGAGEVIPSTPEEPEGWLAWVRWSVLAPLGLLALVFSVAEAFKGGQRGRTPLRASAPKIAASSATWSVGGTLLAHALTGLERRVSRVQPEQGPPEVAAQWVGFAQLAAQAEFLYLAQTAWDPPSWVADAADALVSTVGAACVIWHLVEVGDEGDPETIMGDAASLSASMASLLFLGSKTIKDPYKIIPSLFVFFAEGAFFTAQIGTCPAWDA
jgi:hypothetical protein